MSFHEPLSFKREAPECTAKGIGACIPLGVLHGARKFFKIFAGGLLRFNVLGILQVAACHGTHFIILIDFYE